MPDPRFPLPATTFLCFFRSITSLIAPCFLLSCVTVAGAADDRAVSAFYKDKVVRVIVGFPPGGGADTYTRLIARHLGRFIPGSPTVVVQNMPGAGSMVAANYVFNRGAKDGSEIGMLNGAVILEQLFGNAGVNFDMAKFRYLAVPVNETYVMIVTRKSGIAQFADLIDPQRKETVFGAIPNSTLEHAPILLRDSLKAKIRVVSGYKGSAALRVAVDAGEIGGFFNPWSTIKSTALDKFNSGEWRVIAQLTNHPLSDLPTGNVPTITEITKNSDTRSLLYYGTAAPNQFGKSYMLPPGVPLGRASALEAAFAKTMGDEAFLKDAKKSRLEITPLYGAAIERIVNDFLGMPAAIEASLAKAIKK